MQTAQREFEASGGADAPGLPSKCLHCAAPLTTPIVCDGCHTLFPIPSTSDHFDLLGLPRRFRIDESRLHAVFRAIARNIHPDRFGQDGDAVREMAARLSAELNHAFHVLSDPVRRADYLLERSGGPSAADLREVPGDFLAETMMLREEIDAARTAGDRSALARHRGDIEKRREEAMRRIAELADRLPNCTDTEKADLRRTLNSMKYFDNLLNELALDPLEVEPRGG